MNVKPLKKILIQQAAATSSRASSAEASPAILSAAASRSVTRFTAATAQEMPPLANWPARDAASKTSRSQR